MSQETRDQETRNQKTWDQQTWRKLVKRLISTQMKKRDVKYEILSQRLSKLGIKQSASNLSTKVSTGVLGADLLLAILFALDFKQLTDSDIEDVLQDLGVNIEQLKESQQ
ncbi:MAG: hypothetical protein JKY67_19035 [Pseudomonadales bacterium]|nr:hypothetical protein [Pseudomonadales bacterium]